MYGMIAIAANGGTWKIFKDNNLQKTITDKTTTIKKISVDGETEKKITFFPKSLDEFVLLNTTEYSADGEQWDTAGEHVTKLTLPTNLQKIDELGLIYFTKVEHLKIPTSVTYVGSEAFSGWSANQTIDITGCDTSNWDANWKEGCNAQIVGEQ